MHCPWANPFLLSIAGTVLCSAAPQACRAAEEMSCMNGFLLPGKYVALLWPPNIPRPLYAALVAKKAVRLGLGRQPLPVLPFQGF